jgi:hypothetical protein
VGFEPHRHSEGKTMKAFSVLASCFGVVIGVAILYPAFAQPVELCCKCSMSLSTVKQLATGAAIYATDFDDRLFPAKEWTDASFPYLKNTDLYNDPARSSARKRNQPSVKFGFAFFQPLDRVPFFDGIQDSHNVPLFFPSEIRKRNATSGLGTLPAIPRLEEGHAMAFADTSARYVKPDEVPENVRVQLLIDAGPKDNRVAKGKP